MSRAVREFDMFSPEAKILVAVSGGKDSLAVWDMLQRSGYQADGLYLGLGITDYSDTSAHFARTFATARDLKLIEVDLPTEYGYDIPTGARTAGRVPCSACGTSKRHLFDKAALDGSYDVLVTGHNLDDEAAVLFGNVLRWQTEYLARQMPVLSAWLGFPEKVKPLIRLSERDTAADCVISGIDYIIDECPMSSGNKHLRYKKALNSIELVSPGTKFDFYSGFLRKDSHLFRTAYFEHTENHATAERSRHAIPAEVSHAQPVRIATRAERSTSSLHAELEAGQ
ncbi:MAG: tRNA 2-thiocytidine biosynthesis TtcA family protein [Microthrixaceae bacterium]